MSWISKTFKKLAPTAAMAGLGFLTGGAPGAIAGAGLGLAGSIGTSEQNKENAKLMREQNAFNSAEAQINRDWQTEMSNTAHQREVADLQAAGLNPVLSAGGAGASTPGGATASGTQATAENKMLGAMQLYNVMLEQKKLKSEIDLNDSVIDLNDANTNLVDTQAQYVGYNPKTTSQSTSVSNLLGVGTSASNSKTEYYKLQPVNERRKSKRYSAMDHKR